MQQAEHPPVCIFGEVLFDHFPDGRRVLGGAPFNVAWHLQAFGLAPRFISRVGMDAEGSAVLEAMRDWGMDTQAVQRDPQRPTGRVSVSFHAGQPAYDIVADCAYDAIELLPGQLPPHALLYHGTLAARATASRHTLDTLVAGGSGGVFLDVNLRNPWWDRVRVMHSIRRAYWLKLNQDELALLVPGQDGCLLQARTLLADQQLHGVILTLGADGAQLSLQNGDTIRVRPAASVPVVDTVGAGDAFSAVSLLGIIRNWPLALTLERAQQFASLIVGQRGATVQDRNFYRPLRDEWGLQQPSTDD